MKAARRASWMQAAMVMGLMAGAGMARPEMAVAGEDTGKAKPVAFETIERSPYGIWLRPFVMMATSAAEWETAMDEIAATNDLLIVTKIPAPQGVDWDNYAVVVVAGGQAKGVNVREVKRVGSTAVLDVLEINPLFPYNFTEVAPYHCVKIERRGIKAVQAQFTALNEVSDEDFYRDYFEGPAPKMALNAKAAHKAATQEMSWGALKGQF
jgi:hypothetical protein